MAEPTAPIAIRIPEPIVKQIDANRVRQGLNRSDYILQWLPERYTANTETAQEQDHNESRVASGH